MLVSLPSPGGDSKDKPDPRGGSPRAVVKEPKSLSSHDASGYAPTYGTSATDLLPPAPWDAPDLAEALVSRDIAQLFRFLQNHGVSQRRIAALTGQAQSEISEILAGRTVTSYPVLERIALGLGIPRGRLGLAYDENPQPASQPSITQLSRHDRRSEPRAEPARGMHLNVDAKASEFVQTNSDTDINAIVRAVLAASPLAGRGEPLTTIGVWTGLHIRALREAMRLSVRDFAQYLGVSDRMVSKWEAGGPNIQPRPVNQSVLDTCLDRLDDDARQRFTAHLEVVVVAGGLLSIDTAAKTRPHRRRSPRRFGATVPEQAEPTPSEG